MALEVFKLFGSIMVDNDKANKSISNTGKEAEGAGGKLVKLGDVAKKAAAVVGTVFTAKAIVDFGKKCVGAAEALDQTMKKTNVIFGESSQVVKDWALENERTFGLGSGTIQGFMNNIADITQGMGMAKDASIDLSKGATQLGVQLGNWNGINAASAVDDITRAMTGSHDAVAKYGIKLNDAVLKQTAMNMGLGDNFQALSEAEKAQVRYQAILDSSGNAIDYWNEGNRSMSFYLGEAKEQFGNITETIGGLFLPIAKNAAEKFADMVSGINTFVTGAVEGFGKAKEEFEATGEYTSALDVLMKEVFGVNMPDTFFWMVESIIGFFQQLWSVVTSIWTSVGVPIIDEIKAIFKGLGDNSGEIFKFISDAFDLMIEYIRSVWDSVGKPVMDFIIMVLGLVRDAFAERMPQIKEFFRVAIQDIKAIWENNLKPCFQAIGDFINNILAPTFKFVFQNIILPVVDACFKGIKDLWSGSLKPILQGIIDFITGVFSLNFTQAFSGIVSAVGGIFNGLISIVKAPLNSIIGMVNRMIGGLNEIKLPSWIPGIGGKGINIPNIPMLYKGTDYFKGGLALVGEQGPELVEMPRGAKVNTAEETRAKLGEGMTVNIYSPDPLTPSEVARQLRNTQRRMAYNF